MKKILLILTLILLSHPVFAKTIPVEALEDFSTKNPPKMMSIKVLNELNLDKELTFKEGFVVEGQIVDVSSPKRLKRSAGFSFVPLKYTNLEGETFEIKNYYPAKYTTKLNKGQVVKSAALGVGNYFVKGLSTGVAAIEGAVKNEEGNRLKSSAVSLYESSPLSYIEKGQDIEIKTGQPFLLNFKVKNEQPDEPNYEYTEIDN